MPRPLLLALALAIPGALSAQPPAQPPVISVTTVGEVDVTPDRARLVLGVETEAPSAQAAARDNADRQARVMAELRTQGIQPKDIATTGYAVAPKQSYDPTTQQWRIDGYRVSNLVVVTLTAIDRTGAVIDATLAAGANRVADLRFEVADPTAARELAITRAVERARREAEIAAKAAGGSLSGLVELRINDTNTPSPRPMVAMVAMRAEGAETPISEGTQMVTATVSTGWGFVQRQ